MCVVNERKSILELKGIAVRPSAAGPQECVVPFLSQPGAMTAPCTLHFEWPGEIGQQLVKLLPSTRTNDTFAMK